MQQPSDVEKEKAPAKPAMEPVSRVPNTPISKDRRSHLHFISSVRSTIFPPSSPSEAIIRSAVHAISLHLNSCDDHDSIHIHQTLNLLTHISLLHPSFSSLVISTVRSYLHGFQPPAPAPPDRFMLDALVALISVSGVISLSAMEGGNLASVLSSPNAAVRLRALNLMGRMVNADSDSNYVRVFWGFLKDPYPLLRRAALDGLVAFSKMGSVGMCSLLKEGMYDRTVELLLDRDEFVRLGAVRLVCECGQMVADATREVDDREQLDDIFLQLCSMVRDMSMEVRVEAFLALGKTRLVSEDVLLQTLSKKLNRNERKGLGKLIGKESMLSISSAAGAFVHGLEDEFYEVRRAACASLGSLIIFSTRFADDALDLLTDMLNDDALVVRSQTLKTMLQMATFHHLKGQEKHIHMFLNVLLDADSSIRHATRKLLQVMKLPDIEIFRTSIDGLLTNLQTYPEDEADIFFVLFCIGKSHSYFAVSFVKEFAQEMIVPSSKGELGIDRPGIAAVLVLTIGATFSNEQFLCDIPARLFSCAVPFLGRIASSLEEIMSRDSLLAYLFRCIRSSSLLDKLPSSEEGDNVIHRVERCTLNQDSDQKTHLIPSVLQQSSDRVPEVHLQVNLSDDSDLRQVSAPLEEYHQKAASLCEAAHVVKLILKTVADTWPLIKSGCTEEVLRIMRCCNEELAMFTMSMHSDGSVLAFASMYIKVIKLLAKVWERLKPRKQLVMGIEAFDLLFEKLDKKLTTMRYAFSGFSKEEEFHVLKLILLSCVLRSLKIGICCGLLLKRLHATISRIQVLCEPGPTKLCDFVKELIDCHEGKINEVSYSLPVYKLVEIFSLEQIVFSGRFKHIHAVLHVPGNDSENQIPYISGLPVGITFQITLYNVSIKEKLWLRMASGDSIQYVFLDFCQFEGGEDVRKCMVEVPLYRTPKAVSFTLRACLGMECQSEDSIHVMKGQGGPKHELTILSKEKDIYLVIIDKNS